MKEYDGINKLIERLPEVKQCKSQINQAYEYLKNAFISKNKYLICGNGGSSADADHMVAELVKSFYRKRILSQELKQKLEQLGERGIYLANHLESSIPAYSLSSQSAAMTAIANDQGYDLSFSQQIIGYGEKDDILVAFTTSGRSENVINAIHTAHALDMHIICFTGNHESFIGANLCDVIIKAPSNDTYRIQEYHLSIYHTLCLILEKELFQQK
ncbi:SIS domain-containing protein [Oceanobacillus profundus]|uniref:D-sedoheptulose-7-phosphate isomerase n=1 Tax=Oceanobacillus TaxID=182709 RepID=UPI000BA76445|nr:SIS domain-containing protein [Oceanobacillus profundus]MDO6450000.1 SIS domain-containing protein [Oceanobacillus profundus]PAE28214.1 hypothetical protein CHI07_15645 [Paenibacillus sp. 7884-2]